MDIIKKGFALGEMKMNNSKDMSFFLTLEKEWKLFERKYNGFPYWGIIRFDVCESLFGNLYKKINMKPKEKGSFFSRGKTIIDILWGAIRESYYFGRLKHEDLFIILQGDISSRFFDCWTVPAASRCLVVSPFGKISKNNCNYQIGIPQFRFAISYILTRIIKIRNDKKEKAFLDKIEKELLYKYGQVLSGREIESLIQKRILRYKIYEKYFERLFKKAHVKMISFECYYDNTILPAIEAARKLGVKTIELQHGVVNNHEEYWFEDQSGINNYTPDYFLTFGDVHNTWIKPLPTTKIVTIGYPWQQKMIEREKNTTTDEKMIVIYPDASELFENTVSNAIDLLTTLGYKVFVKLHPNQSKEYRKYYPILSKNINAKFIVSQKKGIYYWLKRGKYHIMASTTVGLEAMVFDHTRVFISAMVPHDQTQCLVDWGVASQFFSSEDLVKKIISDNGNNDMAKRDTIRKMLWKSDAKNNMENFFASFYN